MHTVVIHGPDRYRAQEVLEHVLSRHDLSVRNAVRVHGADGHAVIPTALASRGLFAPRTAIIWDDVDTATVEHLRVVDQTLAGVDSSDSVLVGLYAKSPASASKKVWEGWSASFHDVSWPTSGNEAEKLLREHAKNLNLTLDPGLRPKLHAATGEKLSSARSVLSAAALAGWNPVEPEHWESLWADSDDVTMWAAGNAALKGHLAKSIQLSRSPQCDPVAVSTFVVNQAAQLINGRPHSPEQAQAYLALLDAAVDCRRSRDPIDLAWALTQVAQVTRTT